MHALPNIITVLTAGVAALAGVSAYSTYHSPDGNEIIAEMPYMRTYFSSIGGLIAPIYTVATEWIGLDKSWLKSPGPKEICNLGDQYLQNQLGATHGADVEDCKILLDWASRRSFFFTPGKPELNDGKGYLLVAFYKSCGFAYKFADLNDNEQKETPLSMGNVDMKRYLETAINEFNVNGKVAALFLEVCDEFLRRGRNTIIFNASNYPHTDMTEIDD